MAYWLPIFDVSIKMKLSSLYKLLSPQFIYPQNFNYVHNCETMTFVYQQHDSKLLNSKHSSTGLTQIVLQISEHKFHYLTHFC